jgi:capsular polysaccharide biosynthesis protein
MEFRAAVFDDLVAAGARYYPPSRDLETPIAFGSETLRDTEDDFLVLDDVVLPPRAGLVWRGLWLGPGLQYMGQDWQSAHWLPGRYRQDQNVIEISADDLQPRRRLDGPVFFVDSGVAYKNFGHFLFDCLPYASLFQRIRAIVPKTKPILNPLGFENQRLLFETTFDLRYSEATTTYFDFPIFIKTIVVARRQTDFDGPDWRTSFASLRYARQKALASFGLWKPDTELSRLKIYLHRLQDLEKMRREGAIHGRNFSNVASLCELLLDRGYLAFEPSLVPLQTTATLLQDCRQLVSIHGAGLANVLFCRPGTQIVELRSHLGAWRCYEAVSAVLGLNFRSVPQPPPLGPSQPALGLKDLESIL